MEVDLYLASNDSVWLVRRSDESFKGFENLDRNWASVFDRNSSDILVLPGEYLI